MELVLERFRLLAERRAMWLQKIWSEEADPGSKVAIAHAEAAAAWHDSDAPEKECSWADSAPETLVCRERLAEIEARLESIRDSRFAQAVRIFGLTREEADLFEACLAVAIDPSLARLCAYLQDHSGRTYVTEELAARLFRYGRCTLWSAESALYRWELLHARDAGIGEPRALSCDPHLRDWALGRDNLDPALVGLAQIYPPRPPLPSWPVERNLAFVKQAVQAEDPSPSRITITGPRGSGRRSFAAAVSAGLGLPLLAIDADAIDDARWNHVFLRAQRHAFLERCSLAWCGDSIERRLWPAIVPWFPVQFAICDFGREPAPVPSIVERRVAMRSLSEAERHELWRKYVPWSATWPEKEFHALVKRYRVYPGDLADAARVRVGTARKAALRLRQSARARLGDLAQLLECPFHWDDLVVADELKESLRDVVFEAANRVTFWESRKARRMFPQGRGLLVLFSGPPGTGKTMAAQAIAAALRYDLFRIDLAGVVSKYVGETSKNLQKILSRAADMDAILLFDEADAMFSKRATEVRDAQDKFANTDAAYLLQAIENYPGVALLATNQKGSIDPAFIRRLRFVLDFSKPDAAQRCEIWRRALAGLTDEETRDRVEGDLKRLSESVEATGAQIKNAVLGAIFVARRQGKELALPQLLRGLERELAKEGRSLSTRDKEAMSES